MQLCNFLTLAVATASAHAAVSNVHEANKPNERQLVRRATIGEGEPTLSHIFTKYDAMPLTMQEAVSVGYEVDQRLVEETQNGNVCDPNIGIPFTHGNSKNNPYVLYYTNQGQLSGLGTRVHDYVMPKLLDLQYFQQVSNAEYLIQVSTRYFENGADMCSGEIDENEPIGNQIVVQPNGANDRIPIEESSEMLQNNYRKGSCFDGMGFHYFKDLATPDNTMSWVAENLMPVVPMYHEGKINAIFFASAYRQQSFIPGFNNGWEPIPLVNFA
eukprot:Pgem_evm1s16201